MDGQVQQGKNDLAYSSFPDTIVVVLDRGFIEWPGMAWNGIGQGTRKGRAGNGQWEGCAHQKVNGITARCVLSQSSTGV